MSDLYFVIGELYDGVQFDIWSRVESTNWENEDLRQKSNKSVCWESTPQRNHSVTVE